MAHTKEQEKAILDFVTRSGPVTNREIADGLLLSYSTVFSAVSAMLISGDIISIPYKKGIQYYIVKREATSDDVGTMHEEIAKETIIAKGNYEELAENVERVDKNVNGLYANIISLMSIFVAIFALITVNANMVFNVTPENMAPIFWGIIKVNGFVVVCIIALLFGVRLIIINPLIENKRKTGDKKKG